MNRLEGKVVIITGASGGLGKQMALRFAQEGAKLAICARREKKLQETKDLCQQAGAQVLAMVAEEALHSGLYGTWQMMQLCFPYMKEHGGSIINFGSIGGVNGLEGFAAYAAEKEAIRGLSRVVAREWGQFGIRVNCVCPNVITDRFEEGIHQSPKEIQEYLIGNMSQNAMHRPGKAYEDFTPAALFLASEDSRWVTGQTLHVEGGAWISA